MVEESNGRFRIEFTTVEVGSYVVDVTVGGLTVPNSPLIAKAYDAGLIRVTDIQDGVIGELSTFRGEIGIRFPLFRQIMASFSWFFLQMYTFSVHNL